MKDSQAENFAMILGEQQKSFRKVVDLSSGDGKGH